MSISLEKPFTAVGLTKLVTPLCKPSDILRLSCYEVHQEPLGSLMLYFSNNDNANNNAFYCFLKYKIL